MPDDDAELEEAAPQPRALWSGSITFGLLSLAVDLFPASRSQSLPLKMVDAERHPLTRRYFCPKHNRMLTRDEIIRGYQIADDQYVVITDEELESIAPEKSRVIDLRRFVKASEIDPMYYKRSYFLIPSGEEANRAYRLLAETMERSERVGIATFVMRGKEYLVALLAEKGILRAATLRFPDELRSPEDIGMKAIGKASADAVQRFQRAIAELRADDVDREELTDAYTARLRKLVEHKLEKGIDVVKAPEALAVEEGEAEIIDLMEVLKRRLQPEAAERAPAERPGVERGGRAPPARASARPAAREAEERSGRDAGKRAAPEARERPAPEAGGSGAGEAGRGAAAPQTEDELAGESKSQLYERAKALQVPGRSKMDREELLEALRNARA